MKSSLPRGILLPVKINRYAELLMPPISRSNKLQESFFSFFWKGKVIRCNDWNGQQSTKRQKEERRGEEQGGEDRWMDVLQFSGVVSGSHILAIF